MIRVLLFLVLLFGFARSGPVEVSDQELDAVYASGLFIWNSEIVSELINELRDSVLQIPLPEHMGEGTVIISPAESTASSDSTEESTASSGSTGESTVPESVNVISIAEGAQTNSVNTVNASGSAVNQVLNIIIIVNSDIGEATLNLLNQLDAISIRVNY